jgi:hypothetical protein
MPPIGLRDKLEAKRKENRDKLAARTKPFLEADETVREVMRARVGNPTNEDKQGPLVAALSSGGHAVIVVTDRHLYVFKAGSLGSGIDKVVFKAPIADVAEETLEARRMPTVYIGGRFFLSDDPGSQKGRIGELRDAIGTARSQAPHGA